MVAFFIACFLLPLRHGEAEEPTGDGREDEIWGFFRGDPAMTGVAKAALGLPLELAWTYRAPGEGRAGCKATPLIGWGGVFVGGDDGEFRCLELKTGMEVWSFQGADVIEGAGCFTSGGLVVFGSGDGIVSALDRETGKQRWRCEVGGDVLGGMNLHQFGEAGGEELVVFGSYDNFCYAVDAVSGEKRWEFETENYINGAVAIAEGMAMFGGCDGFLYLLDVETGARLGTVEVGSYVAGTVGVDKGVAFLGHYGNRVAAFRLKDKEQLWEYGEREFPFFSSPAVLPDRVIIGGRDRRVHCVDRLTGKGIWEFRAGGQVDSSPVVSGEVVFIGCDDGMLYGLALADGAELWSYELGQEIKGSPAVADGFLVVTTDDGSVHAFRSAGFR